MLDLQTDTVDDVTTIALVGDVDLATGPQLAAALDRAAADGAARVVAVAAGAIAEASLYIYLTHFQVYPLFGSHRLYGVVASVVIGIALTAVVTQVRARMRDRRLTPRDPARAPALR